MVPLIEVSLTDVVPFPALSHAARTWRARSREAGPARPERARGLTIATSAAIAAAIIAGHSLAVALFVLGATCGDVRAMNACWIVAVACLYGPLGWITRAPQRAPATTAEEALT